MNILLFKHVPTESREGVKVHMETSVPRDIASLNPYGIISDPLPVCIFYPCPGLCKVHIHENLVPQCSGGDCKAGNEIQGWRRFLKDCQKRACGERLHGEASLTYIIIEMHLNIEQNDITLIFLNLVFTVSVSIRLKTPRSD